MVQLDLANASELQKEQRIHDYFCKNITYDHEGLNTANVKRLISAHSIIGVFSKQTAVCEGIAKTVKLLFNAANMGCIVVSGKTKRDRSGHAWNIVKVDGKAYHLDVTWDINMTCGDQLCYDYFNVPDEAIKQDHFDFFGVPLCSNWDLNYFETHKLRFRTANEVEKYITHGIKTGRREFYFHISDLETNDFRSILTALQTHTIQTIGKTSDLCWKAKSIMNPNQQIGRIMISQET